MTDKPERTNYQYIHFDLAEKKSKTVIYRCINNDHYTVLGEVKWYGPWRQYCFLPAEECVFNVGCMRDIIDFIEQLNACHKRGRYNKKPKKGGPGTPLTGA